MARSAMQVNFDHLTGDPAVSALPAYDVAVSVETPTCEIVRQFDRLSSRIEQLAGEGNLAAAALLINDLRGSVARLEHSLTELPEL